MTATTIEIDTHGLYVALPTGEHARLGIGTWDQAIDTWTTLDTARREGRLWGATYLSVRDLDDPDPRWADARGLRHGELTLIVGSNPGPTGHRIRNGYATPEAAARAHARYYGDARGAAGGWIYSDDGYPIVQGWGCYADVLRRRGRLIRQATPEGERWFVTAPLPRLRQRFGQLIARRGA